MGWGTAHAGAHAALPPPPPTAPPREPCNTPRRRHDGELCLPRVIPPRTRSEEARAAVGERTKTPERWGPGRKLRAQKAVRAGSQRPFGRTPTRARHTPCPRIAREGTLFLTEGGADPTQQSPPAAAVGRSGVRAGPTLPQLDLRRATGGMERHAAGACTRGSALPLDSRDTPRATQHKTTTRWTLTRPGAPSRKRAHHKEPSHRPLSYLHTR